MPELPLSEILTADSEVSVHLTTPDEQIYFDISDDAIKQSLPRINEALTRFITLSTAMAAGALGFLKDEVSTGWGRILAAAFFFSALGSAVIGSIPYLTRSRRELGEIIADVERIIVWKRRWLWACCALLLLGFVAAISGSTARYISSEPIKPIPKAAP